MPSLTYNCRAISRVGGAGRDQLEHRQLPTGERGRRAVRPGLVPAALRTAVPLPVYELGLLVGAVGTAWLPVDLLRRQTAR